MENFNQFQPPNEKPVPPSAPEPMKVLMPEVFRPADGIECFCPLDFRRLPVEPGTVKAVITDVPWSLPNASEFSAWCARVLVPGGIAVIHHPKDGGLHGGCRSRVPARLFTALLEKHGLTLVRRFDSWSENGQFNLSRHGDCISVFTA